MAIVRGIHILAHGNIERAREIAQDIQHHQRLLVGVNSLWGSGVYAWHEDRLPTNLRDWPQVLFGIDDNAIIDICRRDGTPLGFFRIPGIPGTYVNVQVLEVNNI